MPWFGSKTAAGVAERIIAQMPPHDTYIEPFAGSGAVLRAKAPAARSIAIDLDPRALALIDRSAGVEVIEGDAVAVLESLDWDALGRVLVYADPPYLWSTRGPGRYRHDLDDAGHRRLLAHLKMLPAAVILSGYPSALYDAELGGWRTTTFQTMTRGGVRTEKLWMNFPAGDVAWHRHAGRNFTDRQRIKRKAQRWAANFRRLPAGERAAILAALMGEDD